MELNCSGRKILVTVRMGKKQTYKNLVFNILAFVVQFVTSFYISPIIVSGVGAAAYGFIGLANDFISYAGIITSVFNSVAARFIANSYYKKDFDKANNYFNSLIVTNFGLAGVFGVLGVILVPNLNQVISVPIDILVDVKITFALTFLSYCITLITMVFTTSTFVANRTDLQGIRDIIKHIVRFALIIVFLNFVSIKLYWTSAALLIATAVVAVLNVSLTRKLTPELKFSLKMANVKYASELAKSGCWMALTSISTILLRGLDLTIANIMLGEYEMGILSIARTFPNNFTSVISTIAPVFTPVFLSYYAKKNLSELKNQVEQSINMMALIMFVPISGFIVFSQDFYGLWQRSLTPTEINMVAALSSITVIQAYFNSTTATMAQLSVVSNKLKLPVFISLGCGLASIIMDILLIKFTSIGIYALVISPTVVMILRYVLFNSIYGAYCINQPWKCFFSTVMKTWVAIPILIIGMIFIRRVVSITNWSGLMIAAILSAIFGYGVMILLFGRDQFMKILKKKGEK